MAIRLFDDQENCIGGIKGSYKRGKRAPLLVSPTGSGKTVMFSHVAQGVADKGNQALIMAHRKELLTQCGNKLMENRVDFGYINPGFTPDYGKAIQVGTIQSIASRMQKIPRGVFDPKLIIIDEAHRASAKTYRDIIQYYPEAKILGVTATPVRGDGKGLSDIFDDIVLGPSVKELIGKNRLVQPRTFGPKETIDLSEVRTLSSGDYDLKQLEEIFDKTVVTGDAVDNYRRICNGVPAVAFCVSIKHAIHVAEEFRSAGYQCEHIDGNMSDGERDRILKMLAAGEINVVTSVDLITEGFDAPVVQCAIMLRPTKSLGLFIQMAGRALRVYPGKECAYILDHAGLTLRHGYIDDDREWTLDGRQKPGKKRGGGGGAREKSVPLFTCPVCYNIHEKAKECPHCGYFYEVSGRLVDNVEGELVELIRSETGGELYDFDDGYLVDQLKLIADKRGYGDQWVVRVMDEWQKKLRGF